MKDMQKPEQKIREFIQQSFHLRQFLQEGPRLDDVDYHLVKTYLEALLADLDLNHKREGQSLTESTDLLHQGKS